MNPDPPVSELGMAFARIQGMPLSQPDAATAVDQLAQVAHAVIGSAAGAGASLIDCTGRARSAGATDALQYELGDLQYELGEGPCLGAWATASVVRVDDTASEARWPGWCAAAREQGIGSVLSTPPVLGGRRVGR
ncbi:GAF domain-containing protein [Kocuria rosea]|jgi:GAF domain-containing protein|uniref:GAF domain-containing protein n=1 Tax=Kocuria rosea TaxID=1275 RepID=UPI00203E7137|nr:GAF domain-containing protein [Kocuria rosea]MCM3687318.1 GAF domain-containing protein [Kocuria rosea]